MEQAANKTQESILVTTFALTLVTALAVLLAGCADAGAGGSASPFEMETDNDAVVVNIYDIDGDDENVNVEVVCDDKKSGKRRSLVFRTKKDRMEDEETLDQIAGISKKEGCGGKE